MARFFNPYSGTPGAGGLTLSGLLDRQKQLARDAVKLPAPTEMRSPWQGAAYLGNVIGDTLRQDAAAADIAATRGELAKIRSGIDYEKGPTSEQINQAYGLDEDYGKMLYEEATRRQQEARAIANEERINTRELNEANAKPLSSLAQAAADLKAGRITQEDYDAIAAKETHLPADPNTPGGFKDAIQVRKDYTNEPVYKNYQVVKSSFDNMRSAAKQATPQGDIAMITTYMKMIDPASSVKEGEYATASNAAGVPDKIKNIWNAMVDGQALQPEQRNNFLASARNFYNNAALGLKTLNENTAKFNKRYGVDDEGIIEQPHDYDAEDQQGPQKAQHTPEEIEQTLNNAREALKKDPRRRDEIISTLQKNNYPIEGL